jgi:hypothetical protein
MIFRAFVYNLLTNEVLALTADYKDIQESQIITIMIANNRSIIVAGRSENGTVLVWKNIMNQNKWKMCL